MTFDQVIVSSENILITLDDIIVPLDDLIFVSVDGIRKAEHIIEVAE